MPQVDPGNSGRNYKPKAAPKRPASTAPPRQADQGDRARSRPAPKAAPPAPAFRPRLNTQPFARQQAQAQRDVRTSRRGLPAPPLAQPPVISGPARATSKPSGAPLPRAKVEAFMRSQRKDAQTARKQIVGSIRAQVGGLRGQARVDALDRLLDEIATDPRHSRTRAAIRHYTGVEAQTRRPETGEAKPGPPDKKISGPGGFATINLTAASRTAADLAGKAAPGLKGHSPGVQFVKNAIKDVGTIGSAPFVGGYTTGKAGLDDFASALDAVGGGKNPLRVLTHGETSKLFGQMAGGIKHNAEHPGQYFKEHPVLFALDVSGVASLVGRGAGATVRAAGKTGAPGIRGKLAEIGSTTRSPLAHGDDLAAGITQRQGSKDLIRAGFQYLSDRGLEPLRDAQGQVVRVEQAGRMKVVLKPKEGVRSAIFHPRLGAQGSLNAKRGDMLASRANAQERIDRDVEGRARRVKGVRGRAAREIVSMVTRGVITAGPHFHQDLTNYLSRVRGKLAQHDMEIAAGRTPTIYRHEGEVEAARRNADLVDKVLRSPKALAQAERIVNEGIRHGGDLVRHDTEAAAAGLFEGGAEQARRARLVETAVEHLGGTHGRDPRLTARVQQAKTLERSLRARLNFGHANTPAQRAQIQTQLDATIRMREQIEARNTERLRDRHGNPLEPQQIEAFLRSRGRDPETVAYLPPNVTPRSFHKQFRPGNRGTLTGSHVKTGEQARKGAVENSTEILRAAGVRHVTTLNQARSIDRLIGEHGMMHPAAAKATTGHPLTKYEQSVVNRGGYYTGQEAAEVIDRTRGPNGEPTLVAVRAYPGKLDAATSKIIREDLQGPGAMDTLGQRLLNNRFLTDGEIAHGRTRNVVLADANLVNRTLAHLKPSSTPGKMAQIANRAFRYAVLPQVKWVTGEFFEPLIVRLTASGSGVNVFGLATDLTAATKYLRLLDRSGNPALQTLARDIRAQHMGGMLFGNRGLTNRRTFAEISPHLSAKVDAAYGKLVQKLPATRQMAEMTGMLLRGGGKALLAPLDAVFYLTRGGESQIIQRAALGQSVRREIQEFTGDWHQTVRLSQKALEDVANGHVNTAAQHRLLDRMHELLGKYEGFSPTLRGIIQGPAPFLPWALNSARFIFWTMPAHHSALTAFLVRVNDVVQKDWEEIHRGAPPGMAMAIPTKDGGWRDIVRFTPYGLSAPIAKGEFRGITSQLLPQFSGLQSALEGRDPFGRDLQMSDHRPAEGGDKAKIALNSALEAFIPYLSTIRRAQERGQTSFSDSTALSPRSKPGTSHGQSAARRIFDPTRPTYLHASPAVEGKPIRPTGPVAAPPSSPEQDFWDEVDQAQAQDDAQAVEDFWNEVDGG